MQQQMLQAMTQIPDDVARLAHEQGLGTPQPGCTVTRLSNNWRRWRIIWPTGFLLSGGLFILSLAASINFNLISQSIFFPLIIASMALSVVSLYVTFILAVFVHKWSTLYPCDHGFILRFQNSKLQTIRWDEIETLWFTSARLASRLFFQSSLYTIRCHDGVTLTICGTRRTRFQISRLDQNFATPVIRRRLPFLLADYQAGQTLNFGELRVNREGVGYRDTFLEWEQIADIVLVKDQRLIIYKAGEQREIWLNLPSLKIPNLSLFMALVKRIRSGQSEQEAGAEALTAIYGPATTVVQATGKIDALPDGLAALAEEHRLGERRLDQNLGRSCLTGRSQIIAMVIFDLLSIVGVSLYSFFFISSFTTHHPLPSFISSLVMVPIYFLLFIYLITYSLIRSIQQIHNDTYTFEYGMLLKRKQQEPVVYRWEDVAVIWRVSGAMLGKQQSSMPMAVYGHTLQLHNGEKYTLTRLNMNQVALGKIIKEQIVPLQLPALISAFQAGQTITFGTIQVQRQGLTVGKRTLPWSQVKSVALKGQLLTIHDITQRKPWHRVQALSIPNLFLLFALVDYARATGAL